MYDVIVIGAGPAGIMASLAASKNNRKVLLIDKNDEIGKKLSLTGGTRCNLTNLKNTKEFINELPINGKYMYSSLNNFNAYDIFDYFKNHGVDLKVEDHDRVFPVSNRSTTIINLLKKLLIEAQVEIIYNKTVKDIKVGEIKAVVTNSGEYKCHNVIIATGGKSYPQTGSTGDGYNFASKLGHAVTELYPAEVYVVTKKKYPLSGLTLNNVVITFNKHTTQGSLLFTHVGLSGPAIFPLSEHLYNALKDKKEVIIYVDLLPHLTTEELTIGLGDESPKNELKTWLRTLLPVRLSDYLLDVSKIDGKSQIANFSKKDKEKLFEMLKKLPVTVTNTGSLNESIITGGGVAIDEINSKTMESKKHPGIYFVGEVIDVHGPMGGYNLTIAFSTGYTAGMNIK